MSFGKVSVGILLLWLGASSMAKASCGVEVADQVFQPIELFNGRDFTGWEHEDGSSPRWNISNGYMEVVPGAGTIQTAGEWENFELHVEFWVPSMPNATGQDKGNSGVYLLGRYEVQILDSIDNPTYFAGSCGSLYRQIAPSVNASRPAGSWQEFDISFFSPRVDGEGQVIEDGRISIVHNQIPIIQNARFNRPTGAAGHKRQGIPGPIQLQDHHSPVRFRNLILTPMPRT